MTPQTPPRALVALLVLAAACAGDSAGPKDPPDGSGDPAALERVSGDGQFAGLGLPLPDSLAVKVVDDQGDPISGIAVAWSVTGGVGTVSPATSNTNIFGVARAALTVGAAPGTVIATAAVSGLAPVTFTATATGPPQITGVSPDTMLTGALLTIYGTSFGAQPALNQVTINGVPATVVSAVPTQLAVRVPCLPTGETVVEVTSHGAKTSTTHPLRVSDRRTLAIGESYTLDGANARCSELLSVGTYVAVVASLGDGAATNSLRMRGSLAGAGPPAVASRHAAARPARARDPEVHGRHADHDRIMRANYELLRTLGPLAAAARAAQPSPFHANAAAAVPQVGDTVTLRVPTNLANVCSGAATVRARVVYSGTRGIVLEDITSPLAGTIDATYQAMGQEFDEIQFPILNTYFGNPFAYEAQTDNDERIWMLFSPVVNARETVAGFVSTGDLLPIDICPASNLKEIFYGIVPTLPGSEDGGSGVDMTAPRFLRTMRTVVIHEAKHITSVAELIARNSPRLQTFSQERWLEESTAMVAEELFSRAAHGYAQNGNTGFQASLYCERHQYVDASCTGKPYAMYDHFYFVYSYLSEIETLSPLFVDDISYYGSGWSLIRYIVDQYDGGNEAGFLRAVTTEQTLVGGANLAARAGRPFADLLVDWLLAHALDDHPTYAVDGVYTMPSWDTRDVFAGMNGDDWSAGNPFPLVHPLQPHTVTQPSFAVDVQLLRGGTGALFEFTGAAATPRLLELSTTSGGPAPVTLRLKVLRVQ